jgi:hypothetical protein
MKHVVSTRHKFQWTHMVGMGKKCQKRHMVFNVGMSHKHEVDRGGGGQISVGARGWYADTSTDDK